MASHLFRQVAVVVQFDKLHHYPCGFLLDKAANFLVINRFNIGT
jgi:hypothetical protein